MKKSNKITVFYIVSSVFLMIVLLAGGIYGMYISVGLNFVKSSVNNFTENLAGSSYSGGATNVAFGGSVNFESSMSGVIILSILLIVLGIFDIISLIKQVIFFKQFKAIKNSSIEQKIEKKVKSKSGVVWFAAIIDLLSVIAGVAGIFINARSLAGGNIVWVLYLIDALVSVLALVSFVLLLVKLKTLKNNSDNNNEWEDTEHIYETEKDDYSEQKNDDYSLKIDVDDIEYKLLKLKYLKTCKMLTADEYENLRKKILAGFENNYEDIILKNKK